MIEIVSYEPKYQPGFKKLNLTWLDQYHLTESHDLEILDDPEGTVLTGGGSIFLAVEGEQVIGSAGIRKSGKQEYELVKMSVDPSYRGRGIGRQLIEKCLDAARRQNAKKVILFSNSQLKTAIQLYEKYGFRHVVVTGTPLQTADVKMELMI